MKKADMRWIITIILTWIFVVAGNAPGVNAASLPEGLMMREVFKPGIGSPVGKILLVQGEVVIMHAEQKDGYWARKDLPLFKGDILVTQPKGRVRLGLIDESILTLGSDTKIEINESLYSHKKKSRFSFIRMSLGKARFFIKKLMNLKRSRFKVRTATAVIGVRGTEFIVIDEPGRTIVYAIKDPIEVASLAAPEKVVQLLDSEKTTVLEGQLPTDPIRVDPSEFEALDKFFIIASTPAEIGASVEIEKKLSDSKDAVSGSAPAVTASSAGIPGDTSFLVPEKELVEPEESPEQIEQMITPEVIQDIVQREQISAIQQQDVTIKENLQETIQGVPPLPDFPQLP